MNCLRSVSQRAIQLRKFHKCVGYCQVEAAVASAPAPIEKLPPPILEGGEMEVSPKIEKLFQDIASLNLIEVAQLSDVLKKRLNLPDAPVMAMNPGMMANLSGSEEDDAPKREKTAFTVRLLKYDEKQKVALIKEIKTLVPDMNLVQAKKFVESVPAVVKADVTKEEAEKLKESVMKAGGEVEIV